MKMRSLVVVAAALLGLCGVADVAPSRLDVTARPDGAKVFVDGVLRGTAGEGACTLTGITPCAHHVRVEAPGYVAADEIVQVGKGAYVRRNFELQEEKGLVLVKSTPSGADVKYNGVSLGTTPLLLTTLASGQSHTLELFLNGFRAKKVSVQPEGRRPIVVEQNLSSDSGVLKFISEPAGATVTVNGVERGRTPLDVSGVPKGVATVKFHLDGYQDVVRDDLHVSAGEEQTLSVVLKGVPARLTVVSTPEQARVFVDDDYQGKTPTTVGKLAAGAHKIRVELAGHAPMTRDVTLANGGETTEEFRLENVLGRIEVVTTPPGAKVLLDGKAVGTTRSPGGDATRSQILALEAVPAGEHSVAVHLDGHQEVSRTIIVKSKETGKLFLKLARIFQPDTEVETVSGVHRGVFVEKDLQGNVTLELSPGVRRTFRREEVRKTTPIMGK